MIARLTAENIKEFNGCNIDQMLLLDSEGIIPASMADLMQGRLDGVLSWDKWYDSHDMVLYHPKGDVKIVLDADIARKINPKSELMNGALVLPDGLYEKVDGQEFTRKDIKKYCGDIQNSKQVRKNPFWQALARNKDLLDEYVAKSFPMAKERFNYDKIMGVYVHDAYAQPVGRLWCLHGLDGSSVANGYSYLSYDCGRLVGVAPEALGAEKNGTVDKVGAKKQFVVPTLEQVLAISDKHIAPENQEAWKTELSKLYN